METIYQNVLIWIEFDINSLSKKLKVPTSNVFFDQLTNFFQIIDFMSKRMKWKDVKEIKKEKIDEINILKF